MKTLFAICLVLSLVLFSCGPLEPRKEKTAEELADKGTREFDKGHYRAAILTFYQLRDWYPFSKHVIPAELKIADSYFHLKLYERAVFAYRAFESLHPRNEATPYAISQIGLSHLSGVDTPDRDQASARKALETFQRLTKQFPDSLYTLMAREKIKACRESLAGHELAVGAFYYKRKNFRAAIDRFKGIITDYPDVSAIHSQAKDYIDLSEKAMRGQVPGE